MVLFGEFGGYIYILACWGLAWYGALPLQCMALEEKKITIITPNLDFVQFELWPRMRDTRTFALYRLFFFFFFFLI